MLRFTGNRTIKQSRAFLQQTQVYCKTLSASGVYLRRIHSVAKSLCFQTLHGESFRRRAYQYFLWETFYRDDVPCWRALFTPPMARRSHSERTDEHCWDWVCDCVRWINAGLIRYRLSFDTSEGPCLFSNRNKRLAMLAFYLTEI